MDTQPPEDPSALVRKVAELQAEISGMKTELTEIKRLLSDKGRKDSLPHHLLHDKFYGIHKSRSAPREKIRPVQDVEISGGESLRLPDNRWLHRCGKCACTWLSSNSDPGACVRHRADKKGPRCGTTRWREIHDEYWENAAAQPNYRYYRDQESNIQGENQEELRTIDNADRKQPGRPPESPYVREGAQAICTRCGHTWIPFVRRPKQCPACRQTWYKPKAWTRNKSVIG